MKSLRALNHKGFSLVELIVVIAVMAILAAIAIPTFAHFIVKANEAADIQFMHDLERAIILSRADTGMGEISNITVEVNTYDGSIQKITYIETVLYEGKDTPQLIECVLQKTDEQEPAALINWDYTFKAHDGVTHHSNWSSKWIIKSVTINPWD